MPTIIGGVQKVVETAELAIGEYAGNVATTDDRISIAHVVVSAPASEPWLTLHYDEWICVLKGRMVLQHEGGEVEAAAGATVFIAKGERFRPVFPEACEYVPVCLPAFRPDRCIREDEAGTEGERVAKKLKQLHGMDASGAAAQDAKPEVLYHMCQRAQWEAAQKAGEAYFPPTFEADGFTHATGVPSRLIETANHFYQQVAGEWVCLRMTRTALRKVGIVVRDERALPVGAQAVGETWGTWVCPHILGGIPPSVVDAEFPMARDGPRYLAIPGVTDA
jgi:uncharacterized protein (DUF952 family)/mannose-6-phosphate isomerase-like protein (cupin superfamily)